MKKNILKTMNNLEIDENIRGLVKQLWKHNYATVFSCSGHDKSDYSYIVIMDKTGDGWFEKNVKRYGLERKNKKDCCERMEKYEEKISTMYPEYEKANFCVLCGYGFNGLVNYEGTLIPDPFKPSSS